MFPRPWGVTAGATSCPIRVFKSGLVLCEHKVICLNGGTSDSNKCVCPGGFHGPLCENPVCQNGGTWSAGACLCLPGFQGFECEFTKETIEVKPEVNATVEVQTKITNRNFTEDLQDNTSTAYKDFAREFTEKMAQLYKDIKGYLGVKILGLKKGSIVVDYEVMLVLPINSKLNTSLNNITEELVTAVKAAAESEGQNCHIQNTTLCFNASSTFVGKTTVEEVNSTAFCRNRVPANFSAYYMPLLVSENKLLCVSRCHRNTSDHLNCHHGACQVTRQGPQCFCLDPVVYWYPQANCQRPINKFALGLGVPLAVLTLLVLVLTAFFIRARRKRHEESWREQHMYEDNDDMCSVPGTFTLRNLGPTDDSESSGSFHVDLQSVDTSQPVHIQRPVNISQL
ncbi:mucin-3A [Alligator mississippiensis]|uniref:Mucin-3A n=1 Tax=Alligator mississippiensis TaxID=8496 RepID=A0A151N7P0_ALLMI|nr:mucin-3A [Alligator mississippiensis]